MADSNTYGGLAKSAFPTAPSSLLTSNKIVRYRKKPGRSPTIEWVPVKASETILNGDILNRTAVTAGFERAINPAGTADTATLSGDITDATAPLYMAMHDNTSGASVDDLSKIAVLRLDDIQILVRLYHATAATSGGDDINVGSWRYEPTTLYEFGIYEYDDGSANYQLILDVNNQDDDDGVLRVMELATEYGISTNFGMAWVEFEVGNLG